jgi:Zn-dependent protease/predicted transcriptional regulator
MFGKRFDLFTLLGFRVSIDTSWFFLAVLVTWSFATGVFPAWNPSLSTVTYWLMGAAGAVGFFLSIVTHELAHSIVARRHGVAMRGITLFIFGGVAEMTDEPPSAQAEFRVAIAGPLSSTVIALACLVAARAARTLEWPVPIEGVFFNLGVINGVLVLFNLIPAFPLDGGRVLRSALWSWKKNLTWATFITSRIGVGFSYALMGWGVLRVIDGDHIGGIWSFLIGLFLRGAANMSYQQIAVRRSLEGESVRRFMRTDPITAPADISIENLVQNYVYHYHYKMFPVVEGESLLGCIRTSEIKQIPRDEWGRYTVRDVTIPVCEENSVVPDVAAARALAKMRQSGTSRLLVIENGRLAGVITLRDLLAYLSLKIELEQR